MEILIVIISISVFLIIWPLIELNKLSNQAKTNEKATDYLGRKNQNIIHLIGGIAILLMIIYLMIQKML